jgi:hypothetical protein
MKTFDWRWLAAAALAGFLLGLVLRGPYEFEIIGDGTGRIGTAAHNQWFGTTSVDWHD